MYIKTFQMQPFAVNSYLAWTADGQALVVDCGGEPERLLAEIAARKLRLGAILLTHLHHDHILGVARLAETGGVPVFAPAADAALAGQPGYGPDAASPAVPPFAFKPVAAGRTAFLGEPCLVLPVPGHTPGHVVYFFPRSLVAFTGDTLFRGSVGRTDSSYGNAALLLASIRDRLLVLPEAVELFPGHGPSTTVGREKRENPFFAPQTPLPDAP
jgi:glyoxylase-like metal-dependent hydrolase (beta-lactamase superfamily II)